MNLGKTILELRRQMNVTQEELAAELGVTAAAVSKWENGYTLPDILMLCALADYFAVTTDELLGRAKAWKYAVIAARTEALGNQIKALAHTNQDSAVAILLISMDEPMTEEELNEGRSGVTRVNVNCDTEQKTLDGFALYFNHMDSIQALAQNNLKS